MDEDAVEVSVVVVEVVVALDAAAEGMVEIETGVAEIDSDEVVVAVTALVAVVVAATDTAVPAAAVEVVTEAAVGTTATAVAPVGMMNGVGDIAHRPKQMTDMVREVVMISMVAVSSETNRVPVVDGEVDDKVIDPREFMLSLLHKFVYKSRKKIIV